jgi:hypothetical protein
MKKKNKPFVVQDKEGNKLFAGNYTEVEDWLDQRESDNGLEIVMSDCTCTNCIFIDGGRRYCYDCEKYTKMSCVSGFLRLKKRSNEK